jgi:paraquat-inducible protein A
MNGNKDRQNIALMVLIASAVFFAMGFMFPIIESGYGIGPIRLKTDLIYLSSSFRFFFDKGEVFIGFILLFFTIIFPILKYIFLFAILTGKKIPRSKHISTALEIINKWSMLDVFVVAVLLLNMKFDSDIIVSRLKSGTSLFALSIVLMMTASFIARKTIAKQFVEK